MNAAASQIPDVTSRTIAPACRVRVRPGRYPAHTQWGRYAGRWGTIIDIDEVHRAARVVMDGATAVLGGEDLPMATLTWSLDDLEVLP